MTSSAISSAVRSSSGFGYRISSNRLTKYILCGAALKESVT